MEVQSLTLATSMCGVLHTSIMHFSTSLLLTPVSDFLCFSYILLSQLIKYFVLLLFFMFPPTDLIQFSSLVFSLSVNGLKLGGSPHGEFQHELFDTTYIILYYYSLYNLGISLG